MHHSSTSQPFKSRVPLFLLTMLSLFLLGVSGIYLFYLFSTQPFYTRSEMEKIFAETRRSVEGVSEEKLAFGESLLKLLETMPEKPEYNDQESEAFNDKKELEWCAEVREIGFLDKLYALAESGPGAFPYDWEAGPEVLLERIRPLGWVCTVLEEDLKRAIENGDLSRATGIMRYGTILARTTEHKTYEIIALIGIYLRTSLLKAVLASSDMMNPSLISTVLQKLTDFEKQLPEPRDILSVGTICWADYHLRNGFQNTPLAGNAWFQFARIKNKAFSIILVKHFALLDAMKKPPPQAIPEIQKLVDDVYLSASPDRINRLEAMLHFLASEILSPLHTLVYHRFVLLNASYKGTRIALALEL